MRTTNKKENVMHDRIAGTALLGASAISAMLLGAASNARAESMSFENRSDSLVSIVFAEPDGSCPSGLRDREWVNLGPRATKQVEVDTSGDFFLGAVEVIPSDPPVGMDIRPVKVDQTYRWQPPADGSNAGQCSDIRENDDGSDPNAGMWHAVYNLGSGCGDIGGHLGVVTSPIENGDPGYALQVGVYCIGGVVNPDTGGDGGPVITPL